jgi:hypothetical protein
MLKKELSIPGSNYNEMAFQWIVNEKMSRLRARLLNLADSITEDAERRRAVKGLIKDFCGEAYYPMLSKIEDYLKYFKVIEGDNCEMQPKLEEIIRID